MSAEPVLADNMSLQQESDINQYLTFLLGEEEYGIDILSVQEIKGWDGVTTMPNTPEQVLGVINLRGTIVPVVCLRKVFELEAKPYDATTVVIVVNVESGAESESGVSSKRTMGIVVDAVSEVHNVTSEDVKAAPDYSGACDASTIVGLVTCNDEMVILLDVAKLLNRKVIQALS